MEGKTVILSVLILSLVMAQIRVEAKSCCPSTTARNIYNTCRFGGGDRPTCAKLSGCKIVDGKCPPGWDKLTQEQSGRSYYCKLGCESSVCNGLSALESSDASDGAVAECTHACSVFCAKSSTDALEISSSI